MCKSWGKPLHWVPSPFLPFISTEMPCTLLSAAHIHGKVLQALVNAQERKCQGRLMGEVKSSWKKFRSSLTWKGDLKGWLWDYENFLAQSAQAKESSRQPVEGRWSSFSSSTPVNPPSSGRLTSNPNEPAHTAVLYQPFGQSQHSVSHPALCTAPTRHPQSSLLSEDHEAGWPRLPTASRHHLLPIRESSVITSFSISAIDPLPNFIKPSVSGITFSLRSVLEVSVFWKSSNFDNEILCKLEHAHSMLYHHMVKFSPPSDLINSVYKFLGMPP